MFTRVLYFFAGAEATRSAVLHNLPDAECVHLTVPVFWTSGPSLALTPDESRDEEPLRNNKPEYLIDTNADLSHVTARLVVVSSSHWSGEPDTSVSVLGVQKLAKALLRSGAQCILVGMWPMPPTAGSILLRAFYSAMLQGQRASRALAEAMQTVQHTRHFAHPANWAGWLLLGADTRLSNKVNRIEKLFFSFSKKKCFETMFVSLN